jgi:UDPglucose 6-dehydrogenase
MGIPAPIMVTDPASAETIKYAANAFLATKLSFVNAVAAICEAVGADVADVMLGIGYDRRIGQDFLKPGPGWGGSCFPKDTRALAHIAEEAGYDFHLLKGVLAVNDEQFERVADKVERLAGGSVEGKRVAVWGLTFKARTDDLRDSPSLEVIRRLRGRGAPVRRLRPGRAPADRRAIIRRRRPLRRLCEGAEVLAVLTEWDEFKWLDFDKVARAHGPAPGARRPQPARPAALKRRGFTYDGIGRS